MTYIACGKIPRCHPRDHCGIWPGWHSGWHWERGSLHSGRNPAPALPSGSRNDAGHRLHHRQRCHSHRELAAGAKPLWKKSHCGHRGKRLDRGHQRRRRGYQGWFRLSKWNRRCRDRCARHRGRRFRSGCSRRWDEQGTRCAGGHRQRDLDWRAGHGQLLPPRDHTRLSTSRTMDAGWKTHVRRQVLETMAGLFVVDGRLAPGVVVGHGVCRSRSRSRSR